ncbi:RNA pseudouridine synthase [Hydrogenovibrio marinus]|uniref:RNA pseudouridine synthase n=2 Tax=Hydrogenovibrio marinus TaxID=28885 RepID=A0A066ZN88_HYDMR|nr:RNA pseudouridine synthase [Hydrogenovibrio marinus]BBN59746.1 RNA pseudouridine synthase [Hydrogenovibrio marinus]
MDSAIKPEQISNSTHPVQMLYRNEHFVLVNKPAGMNFHSEEEAGLAVVVKQRLQTESSGDIELYPVHRLDKMTSGLVLFALTKEAAQAFQTLFENREMDKFYLAIATDKPKKKQGWIKGDMQPARRGSWKLTSTQDSPAITRFISQSIGPNQRLFLVKPLTGKTHQIRVALKSLGAPIAGDERYQNLQQAHQEDRGYLHAFAIRFTLFGESYAFSVFPQEGQRFVAQGCVEQIRQWREPWKAFDSN